MMVIPAIDVKSGRCVRLRQGRMDSAVEFNADPAAQAALWVQAGAQRLHVVDLDGSIEGRPVNLQIVRSIVAAVSVPVQLGGGVRDSAALELYLQAGVAVVILGTAAVRDPEFARRALMDYPGRVALGIDAERGMVSVQGWTQGTGVRARDLASRFDELRPAAFIYTDIARDGMMRGPNLEETAEFAASVRTPVILSGGVSAMSDIEAAMALESKGVMGIIIGRALYDGAIDAAEAISFAERGNAR
jgi:phosphoribosylformimino-5-aminoimidazole carboxamide ribotide isomerase